MLKRAYEDVVFWSWVAAGAAALLLLAGCAAVEATIGYLGELRGYYQCRQDCPVQKDGCDCQAPSERRLDSPD